MNPTQQPIYQLVTLKQIDYGLTNFSLESPPKVLFQSIQAISITHPLGLIPVGGRYNVVCGNRRWKIAQELNLFEVPARIFPENVSEEDQLHLNLKDNCTHRTYSDLEKGSILLRLIQYILLIFSIQN